MSRGPDGISVKYNATHQLTTAMVMTTIMMKMLIWCGILRKKRREIKRNCQWGVSRTRWNICKIQCYSPIDDSDDDDDDDDDDVDSVWYPEIKRREIKRNCQWGVSRTRWNICKIQCYSPIDDSDGDDDDNDDDVDLVWYPEKKEKRNQEKLPVGCLEDQMEYL